MSVLFGLLVAAVLTLVVMPFVYYGVMRQRGMDQDGYGDEVA